MDDLSRTSLPFWFAAGGILAAIVGQLKVEGDLKDIDAMPKVKWWQQRSLGHLMEVAETHRSKFPKSAWRSVWVCGLMIFAFAFGWIVLGSHSDLYKVH